MTIGLEGDLRREFDAATPPSSLTFHPESVVRQGNRTIRRHRIVAGGSAAIAVALVVTGVGLLTRPHDTAAPQPATQTATQHSPQLATSGIVRGEVGVFSGAFHVEFNRDAKVKSNVKFFVVTDKGRREVGVASMGKPGQQPEASWKSGMVDGHPFTVGLVPGSGASVELADGPSYSIISDELRGIGYTAFAVEYKNGNEKEAARPAKLASISWSGPTGIVDGIEGDHRLAGQILTINRSEWVKVMLRPGKDGQITVFGSTNSELGGGSAGAVLSVATTDLSGTAVVTGRQKIGERTARGIEFLKDGAPIAAGILPVGASDIGVILTTGELANGLPVSEPLPDGRVIFAIKAESAQPSIPSKDSIKAVTWTNADGASGRQNVTQHER